MLVTLLVTPKKQSPYLFVNKEDRGLLKWAQRDLNPRPIDYESTALTAELWARVFNADSKNKII